MKVKSYQLITEDVVDFILKSDQKVDKINKSFSSIGGRGDKQYDINFNKKNKTIKQPFTNGYYDLIVDFYDKSGDVINRINGLYELQNSNDVTFSIKNKEESYVITPIVTMDKDAITNKERIKISKISVAGDVDKSIIKNIKSFSFKKFKQK